MPSTKTKSVVQGQDILVSLNPEEKRALKLRARRFGVSPSDFVRIALNQYFMVGATASVRPHSKGRINYRIE